LRNKISVRIIGDLNPDEISIVFRQAPSYEGTLANGKRIWILDSPLTPEASLDEHFQWLLETCAENREALIELGEGLKIDVFFSITFNGQQGGFNIPPDLMSLLGELKIPAEVSIISLREIS
jgi:hypothetical protein